MSSEQERSPDYDAPGLPPVEHGPDWSEWQPGDDGCPCKCGFNGTSEECAASRITPPGADHA